MTDLRRRLPGTGRGIRVAVVDSGLNPAHTHVAPVSGGVWIRSLGGGRIAHEEDWRDRLGHGSAVGGAIRAVAPDVELLAVRIFDDRPGATADQLVGAIRWAIGNRVHIVNLSLCTPNRAHEARLQEVCRLAAENGVVVVAAGPHVPATLPVAIGVAAGDVPEFGLLPADPPLDFLAYGHPRTLPGNRPNFSGHSFAAARVSGFLARLLSAQVADAAFASASASASASVSVSASASASGSESASDPATAAATAAVTATVGAAVGAAVAALRAACRLQERAGNPPRSAVGH